MPDADQYKGWGEIGRDRRELLEAVNWRDGAAAGKFGVSRLHRISTRQTPSQPDLLLTDSKSGMGMTATVFDVKPNRFVMYV
jgi:hypothetical protein